MKKFCLFFVFIFFLFSLNSLCSFAEESQGLIRITSVPKGAEIFLDHVFKGKAPLTVSGLTPGSHLIRANMSENYLPYLAKFQLEAGQAVSLSISLTKRTEAWFNEGLTAETSGQYEEAINDFNEALNRKPKAIVDAYLQIGILYLETNQVDKAIEALRQFAFYRAESPAVYALLGKAYEQTKEFGKSLTGYKLALFHLPSFREKTIQLPQATWKAIAQLEKEEILDPADANMKIQLALLYEKKGLFQKPVALLKQVLSQYSLLIKQDEASFSRYIVLN